MEGKIVAAVGGCAVLAGLAYVLHGGSRSESNMNKKSAGIVGLVNLGNTCYLNSVLQALSSVSTFVSWLRLRSGNHHKVKKLRKLTLELSKLIQILSQPCYEQDSYNPTPIFQSLYSHGWIIPLEQQDAHEIFQVLTSTLADEQERASQESWNSILSGKESFAVQDNSIVHRSGVTASKIQRKFWSPFDGLFANQLSCKTCSNKYPVKFDSFDTISLSLSTNSQFANALTLQELIKNFMCCEVLESFECPKCDKKDVHKKIVLKKQSIAKLPQCLCFHINRTYWQNSGIPYKNNAFVRFPETLEVQPFLYAYNKAVDSELTKMMGYFDEPDSSSSVSLNSLYNLVAVIVHLGGVQRGHYVTYRKTPWLDESWTMVSDETIRPVPISHVLKTNAYMLFYERNGRKRSEIVIE